MAKTIEKLSATSIKAAKLKEGYYNDGRGLYLQVNGNSRAWIFRYQRNRKSRYMGLGSYPEVSLAEARQLSLSARRLLLSGVDPIDARRAQAERALIPSAPEVTFDECVVRYLDSYSASWRNLKHAAQWKSTLSTYASPVFGSLPVRCIDTDLVTKVIEPIWKTKPETASRVRGRIEAVLDWAKVRGYRDGENPARWRGHLKHILPPKADVHKVQHHPSLPYEQLPWFIADLRTRDSVGAAALEFLILTAARTGEVIGMRGEEVNFKDRVWVVPASRMKAGRGHIVPLSAAATAILERMNIQASAHVFPGLKSGRGLSNMAMLKTIERLSNDRETKGLPRYVDPKISNADITTHGFRATFKTWATEQTSFPREVIEAALAHISGDKLEAAYLRGTILHKRRQLMEAWETYCYSRARMPDVAFSNFAGQRHVAHCVEPS